MKRYRPTQISHAYHDAIGSPGEFRPVQQFFIDMANRHELGLRQADGTMPKFSPIAGADLAVLHFLKMQEIRVENLEIYVRENPDSSMFNLDYIVWEGKPADDWFLEITRFATRILVGPWHGGINIEPKNLIDGPKPRPEHYRLNSQIRIGLWWLPAYLENLETQSGGQQ